MIKRREFITLLGGGAAAWPLAAQAQQAKLPGIGFLSGVSPTAYEPYLAAFQKALKEIGYVEGVRCVVSASNSAIKGGTVAPSGQRKGQRVQQIVLENKLPLVHLVESGGANLLYQA